MQDVVLDPRLSAVASLVRGPKVADIGTDHALLPRYLIDTGVALSVIAVEKNRAPAEVARKALQGYPAEVRVGDGFSVLSPGEVNCATLCGLGGQLICNLLSRQPENLPEQLVLQANRDTPLLRAWALENGYHLKTERMVTGFWRFVVLSLTRQPGPDSAYQGLSRRLAVEFGPHLLRERHPLLCQEILERERHFRGTRAVELHGLLYDACRFLELSRLP